MISTRLSNVPSEVTVRTLTWPNIEKHTWAWFASGSRSTNPPNVETPPPGPGPPASISARVRSWMGSVP